MSAIGLCENCCHVQIIRSKRGNMFYLCQRSNEDPSFAKYPRLPVLSCRGFEPEALRRCDEKKDGLRR